MIPADVLAEIDRLVMGGIAPKGGEQAYILLYLAGAEIRRLRLQAEVHKTALKRIAANGDVARQLVAATALGVEIRSAP